jgi:hypothetical protein
VTSRVCPSDDRRGCVRGVRLGATSGGSSERARWTGVTVAVTPVRASTPTCCAGSARSTNGCAGPTKPSDAGTPLPAAIPAGSPTGGGTGWPGEQGDKRPVSREAHTVSCGSRGCSSPGHPTAMR